MDRKLLLDVTSIPSPSGYEYGLIQFIQTYVQKNLKNVEALIDSGELYLIRKSNDIEAKTVLYDAHIDQVSCRVLNITEDGYLIARCFGLNEADIMGKAVKIITETGIIDGLITIVPPHLTIKNKTIYIDIFASNRKMAERLVTIGDPIYLSAETKIHKDYIIGSGLDNHIGVYCLLELARNIDRLKSVGHNFIIHLSRREETGGLKYINFLDDFDNMPKRIDLIFVIDTDIANDVPSIQLENQPVSKLGKGPIITRNLIDDNSVFQYLRGIARSNKIPFQIVMSDGDGGNNLQNYNQISSLGQFIGIPLRNMHSTVETASLRDIENTIQLLYVSFINLDSFFAR